MIGFLPHFFTYFLALIFSVCVIYYTGFIPGEMNVNLEIGSEELLLYGALNILAFASILVFAKLAVRFRVSMPFKLVLNQNRFWVFFLFFVVFGILLSFQTGAGVLFSTSEHPLSFLAVFDPIFILPLFFLFYRDRMPFFLFWGILALFSIGQLQRGWTGFLLLIYFLEMYYQAKRRPVEQGLLIAIVTPGVVFVLGAFVYQQVLPIKNEVRGIPSGEISYYSAMESLASRLTFFPVAVAGYQSAYEVSDFYKNENIILKESYGFLKPILPGPFMPSKSFRSLNNNVKQPYFDISNQTSADIGIVGYLYLLATASFGDLMLSVAICVISLFSLKVVYDLLSSYSGQFDFIIYLSIFSVIYTFSVEHVFARGFLGIFYFLPLLLISGSLRLKKKHEQVRSSRVALDSTGLRR